MPLFDLETQIDVNEFKANYLHGLVQHLSDVSKFDEAYLHQKLLEAEKEVARELSLVWVTKRVRSEPKAGEADWDIQEPAYDYESDFFVSERWGMIRTRLYPVQSVQRFVFAYPNIDSKVFTVPTTWIKLDRDFGIIRIVPDRVAVYAAFSAYILSVFSGGRGIPQSIFIDYTAGFATDDEISANPELRDLALAKQYDLLEHVKRTALVNIMADALVPSSFSASADGLSQSFGFDLSKAREELLRYRRVLLDKIRGPRLAVV